MSGTNTLLSCTCFVICRFPRYTVVHLEQPRAQSLFLFPVFGISLIPFSMGRRTLSKTNSSLLWWKNLNYSETRLLRTLKGNEKRYVVTKVRSMQNAILLTGMTGSTCSRERSATEDVSPFWMSFITRFSYGEIAFRGIVNLKTCRKVEIKTERQWKTCSRSEKKSQRKGKKVLLEGKLVRNIRFCATFCTSYPKKMYMFSDWRCSWSTERTL